MLYTLKKKEDTRERKRKAQVEKTNYEIIPTLSPHPHPV